MTELDRAPAPSPRAGEREREGPRDFIAEVDALIDNFTEGDNWVASVVASQVGGLLAEQDPDLLDGYLYAVAEDTLRRHIGFRAGAKRQAERRQALAKQFAEAAGDYEAGELGGTEFTGLFRAVFTVDRKGTRKRAGDMTGAEHLRIAGQYAGLGRHSLMQAAFHKAVAEKAGNRRLADVMSEETYERLYQSITRKEQH